MLLKKHIVSVKEIWHTDIAIDAKSEKDAITRVENGEGEVLDSQYNHTLDLDEWTVHKI